MKVHRKPAGALLFAALCTLLLIATVRCTGNEAQTEERFFPRLGDYADLYLRQSYDILHMIKYRELGKIGEAAKIAASRKMNGGRIYSWIWTPHIMYSGSCDETAAGNPNIAPDHRVHSENFRNLPEDLGANDFLIVAEPGNQAARERGCYLVGVGYPMSTNRYSPPNYNDHPDIAMESQVDMMIYTWGPKEDGLVMPALTPHLKICPTSPMTVAGYWLLTAQIAHNLAYKDTTGTFEASEAYIDTLMARLAAFHERYIGEVHDIGSVIADRVLNGGKVYPWSSRWEFYQEASGTAGTIMGVYPIHPGGIYTGPGMTKPPKFNPDDVTEKDIFIMAVSGDNPEIEREMTEKVRAKGALIIGIYPFEREDGFDSSVFDGLCDYSLDNFSGDKWGIFDMPGYDTKIIPTVTLMNNYAWWAIIAAYVQEMESRGEAPYYWMSWHVPGGKAYTDSVHTHFLERGY